MNLRSQILFSGLFLLFLQIGALITFFYLWMTPQVDQIEKTIVEKNLHRGLAVLQRELFHLGYLANLLSELPLIQQLMVSPFSQREANKELEEKMLMLGINILDVLSKDHKMIWEKMIDLNTGHTYSHQTFLPRLWEERPKFLMPTSVLNTEAGIYNSQWGPLLIVSAPIFLNGKEPQGALLVGRVITSEIVQLIQSITFAKTLIFPLEQEALPHKQEVILQSLLQQNAYSLIDSHSSFLQGYTVLMDLNDKPDLLISTTYPRDFIKMIRFRALEVIAILLFFFFLFLGVVLFLIRTKVMRPLLSYLSQLKEKNEGPFLEEGSGEIRLILQAFRHLIAFQKSGRTQAVILAYQKGTYEAYQSIIKNIQEIRHFVLTETASMEKYLFSLPLNEVEWLLAQRRIQASAQEETEKWQQVSDSLRLFQKEMQNQLQALHTHILRMMLRTSEQARKPLSHALKKKAHTPYY